MSRLNSLYIIRIAMLSLLSCLCAILRELLSYRATAQPKPHIPTSPAFVCPHTYIRAGFFRGADEHPQLLIAPRTGALRGHLLVATAAGACTSWGFFDGFMTQLDTTDINADGHTDVVIAAVMQSAVAVSGGGSSVGTSKFDVRIGGGVLGAANMAPYVHHDASGDLCSSSKSPSPSLQQQLPGGFNEGEGGR